MPIPKLPPDETERMRAEITRVPLNATVKVRGCAGLGKGTVLGHITGIPKCDGTTIPYRGFVGVRVFFPDDFEGYVSDFRSTEILVCK